MVTFFLDVGNQEQTSYALPKVLPYVVPSQLERVHIDNKSARQHFLRGEREKNDLFFFHGIQGAPKES